MPIDPISTIASSVDAVTTGAGSDASGSGMDFSAQLGELERVFAQAQERNIEMRKLTTEEGTELKAAGKDVNPK